MENVNVSDYQVLQDTAFAMNTLNHIKAFSFDLPSNFVFGARAEKPIRAFIFCQQAERVRFSIDGTSGAPASSEGFAPNTFDTSGDPVLSGGPRMSMAFWKLFSGTNITIGPTVSVVRKVEPLRIRL
jgi:hypothetical protein